MRLIAYVTVPQPQEVMCCCAMHPGVWCAFFALALTLTKRTASTAALCLSITGIVINLPPFLMFLFSSNPVGFAIVQGTLLWMCLFVFPLQLIRRVKPPPSGHSRQWPARAVVQKKWRPHRLAGKPAVEQIQPGEPPQDRTDLR
jgi:hypothetical protein